MKNRFLIASKKSVADIQMKKAAFLTFLISLFMLITLSCGSKKTPDGAQSGITNKTLKTSLKKDHPRLFISSSRIQELKTMAEKDQMLAGLIKGMIERADMFIGQPTLEFKIIGPRMLNRCQQIGDRVSTLALAYNFTNDSKYLDRAKKELFNAGNDPHWNKTHFLDGAELCLAFGIGYDWLYNALTVDERATIRKALVEKGLSVGLSEMQNGVSWTTSVTNWNSVVNGGLAVGALAVADEVPDIAVPIINTAVKNLPLMFASYREDGAWEAGPDYWSYATRYSALAIDAIMTTLGSDYGLTQSEGLKKTGYFPIQCLGPTDLYFNFAGGAPESVTKPELFWLGKTYSVPLFIEENHRLLKKQMSLSETPHSFNVIPVAFNIVWYQPEPMSVIPLPKGVVYNSVGVVTMRSAWNDPNALFVGFKGGFNKADHAHLDIGSFVLDADGVRWASDLGRDNYDIPGYFDTPEGGGRWKIFRLNNFSHNTLTLNNKVQRVAAIAPIVKSLFSDAKSFAVADITSAYEPDAKSVRRGIALINNSDVVIQDEISWSGKDKKALWQMTTDAEIQLKGAEALLKKDGKTFQAQIISPKGAVFSTVPAGKEPPENPNTGYRQLVIDLAEKGSTTTICVVLSARPSSVEIVPLESW
jgi:hypothetical protein